MMTVFKKSGWILCVWLLCLLPHNVSMAQAYLQLYSVSTEIQLAPEFEFLWEAEGKQSIDQTLALDDSFINEAITNPNFGFSSNGLWLRTHVTNVSETTDWVVDINFSQLDYVDFYLLRGTQLVASSRQGKRQGEQAFRIPSFAVALPLDDPHSLYIRVQSDSSSLIVPAKIRSAQSHTLALQVDSLAWGLFYGGLLILAIYNLVLFLSVREASLIAYITYIVTVMCWQFIWGGHVQLMFPQGLTAWFAAHTDIMFALVGISSGLFTLAFLEAKQNAPKCLPLIVLFIGIQTLQIVISVFDLLPAAIKNNAVYGVGILAIASYMAAGIEALFNRFRPASYFVGAWSLLAFGAVIGIFSLVAILPSNTFTSYCFQVCVFLEAGLFSIALMEKSRGQLQGEVEQATTDLRNNMELIEEQNARLDIARKDAIKASNIKSQFLANMSHEIRTPLNAILGFSRELEQANLAMVQNEQVKIINSAADNLLTIVNDVLDFSKIEAGKLQINNSPFAPMAVFEEMVAIMAKTAHSKHLDFVFNPSPLPEKLISDDVRLKQVLTNLIGNALKFTSKGRVSLYVWANRQKHGVIELCFKVEDTGIGISRTDRKKLFSAFSQVDDALNRSYQGTGLGLVISQELVRLMNGTISLSSQPGVGSSFTVMVRAQQLSQRASFSYPQTVANHTVVVFDPSPESRRATSKMLKDLGAQVTSVDSLEFLQRQTQDFDTLMVFLPNHTRYSASAILHCALAIKAKRRCVWYCKDDPILKSPVFEQAFSANIGMPATPSRLIQVLTSETYRKSAPRVKPPQILPAVSILAVDDMAMNLMLLDTWFKDTAVSLSKAHSGEEAVQLCHSRAFDLVLMDVQMPGIDGLQASKEIRKTDLNMGTPIVAVTAHAFKEEQDRLLSSGMDDYLPKPIAYDALIGVIGRWCDAPQPLISESSPAVNWQLALQRANNNEAASQIMLKEFVSLLPQSKKTMEDAIGDKDMSSLKQEIHRLHGASCYTGAPKIQALASSIETALKQKEHEEALAQIPELFAAMTQFSEQSEQLLATLPHSPAT